MPEDGTPEAGLHILGEGGLGFPAPQRTYARVAYGNTQPDAEKARWLTVRPDGSVVAYAGKVEYGQGIRTGLAIEVADELRVPLANVEVVLGDTARVPWDMGTFGSQSTARVGLQLRKAAATARQALLEMAADRLDLPAGDLRAEAGRISSSSDGNRAITYADLIGGASIVHDIDSDIALTPRAEFSVMGKTHTRIDAEARVTGRALYSQDIVVDGMLFGSVLRRPWRGAALQSVDTSIAERMPGVVQVVREDDLVAVLADTDEHAAAAMNLLQTQWGEPAPTASTIDLPEILLSSAHDPFVTQEAGSLEEGFTAASGVLEATYFVPYVSNAPMEPRAAVASWDGDRLTVWAGTQRPFGINTELAQRFGLEESQVRVIAPEIGGGFGSKSPYPVAHEASRLARIAGRPVRVAYTRAEDMIYATMRPAALFRIKSGFTADGRLVAWECHAYHAGDRPFLGRRGSDSPYDAAHVRVTTYTSDSPLSTGSYRSLGAAANHFAREVHIDEVAAAVGLDPVEFRLRNLSHPRFRRVLEHAADAHGWQPAAGASRRGQGIAIGVDVGSYIATAVQLDVGGREVRLDRVTAALDCGLVVNPEGARNQVEGSIVMGMGTALYEAIDFQDGRVLNAGFTRYRVPRSSDAPAIETLLVGDDDTPSTGAGEPGIVPIAAAISNAVFDRTGERQRELPIQRHLR
ncbi:MAG: xanthine dehydrogenase family protein molybdopterin-binding subunit [Chloroflexi bacterium]|nr:xanthine dehydrogenase family protein molybdopterin-binding subunit [Chloroflexota bacterium]